jgi:hypothetical protein
LVVTELDGLGRGGDVRRGRRGRYGGRADGRRGRNGSRADRRTDSNFALLGDSQPILKLLRNKAGVIGDEERE